MRDNDIEQINAVLQSTFHIDPEGLTDAEFVSFYAKYKLIKELEQKSTVAAIIEAAKIILDKWEQS